LGPKQSPASDGIALGQTLPLLRDFFLKSRLPVFDFCLQRDYTLSLQRVGKAMFWHGAADVL
jgi:hypothetical protein